jgi:hypothetical protein
LIDDDDDDDDDGDGIFVYFYCFFVSKPLFSVFISDSFCFTEERYVRQIYSLFVTRKWRRFPRSFRFRTSNVLPRRLLKSTSEIEFCRMA